MKVMTVSTSVPQPWKKAPTFVSRIEEFRTTLFSHFETFYEGKPFTEEP